MSDPSEEIVTDSSSGNVINENSMGTDLRRYEMAKMIQLDGNKDDILSKKKM